MIYGEYIFKATSQADDREATARGWKEIVRCKDCKHSEPWYRDRRRCFLWDECGMSVWCDGFCNYAEREEE